MLGIGRGGPLGAGDVEQRSVGVETTGPSRPAGLNPTAGPSGPVPGAGRQGPVHPTPTRLTEREAWIILAAVDGIGRASCRERVCSVV